MPISQIVTNSIASGQTITSPVIAGTPTGVGVLTLGTAVASTSGTSIDFTSIPSWVKRITVSFQGVSGSSGSSNFQIQLGAGSITTSGYIGAATFHSASAISATNYTSGLVVQNATDANALYSGIYTFVTLGSNKWVGSGAIEGNQSSYGGSGSTSITLGGTLDRVRITTVNGTDTFDAGTINILYE
jgi:hypothetical protein